MTEVAAVSAASEKRFAAALQHRYFLRVHMSAMLALTVLAGIFADRLLARAGLNVLAVRYFVSVCAAYFVFVSSVKLWLLYLGFTVASAASRRSGGSNWIDGFDFSSSGGSSSGGSSGSVSFDGGGGRFGGGGATGSWGEGDSQPAMVPALLSSSKGSGGGGGKGGGGSSDDWGELMLVVLIIAVVVAAIASVFWVIWAAPTILGETAFNAVLAGVLAKHAHRASRGNWIGSVMKKTMIPFLLILALTTILGWYAQHYCPTALRLSDALHCANPAF